MSKVYIKRKGSAIVTLDDWTEGSIRSKQIMDHDYIKIQFSSIKRRTFKLGDYIETEYGRFEITDKTTINFKVNTETGGYDYTLQFDAGYIKWKNKLMKFTPENEVSELTFSLTATLTSHLELFMQNLNSLCAIDSDFLYNGELEWQISIEPTVEDNAQLIEYDGSNLLDILYTYAEKWKCECWVEGNVICFGRCEKFGDPTVFEYENNVEEITPTDSKKDFATRLYVFGGTRNLPANYRRQSAGAITNGIVQKRLMLPEGVPYLQSNDINEEVEIVEACIFLDEIYPKTDCVVDGVNTYTSTVKNEDDTETTQTFYRIGDSSGFLEKFTEDLILEGETLKVTFTSGPLNLMEFELRLVEDDEVLGKCFEIIANDNYGVFLPDSPLVPEDGDTYVVHGWDSTKIADLPLIHDAEEELLNTGKEHLASLEIDPTNYNCKMDSEWMENDGTPRFMEIGDPVELVCPNMENRVSRIIGYEFSLDMPWRDTKYIVGENAKASKFTALEEKISDVESKLTARINKGAVEIIRTYSRNTPTDNNVFSALASLAQFLNKNKPDAAKELIEFLKGLKSDSIESRKFLEGLGGFGGYGFRLGMDDLNNSHLQVDFLEVMKKAVFAELEVRKRTSIGGNLLLSGATSTIVSVEPIVENGVTTGYKCYIKTDDGTMRTQNNWVEGMQALCQSFNVEAGVYQNVENQYYWRVVTEVGQREPVMTFDPETGEHIQAVDEDGNLRWREAYVVLSNDPAYMDSGCSAPMAEDTIVHCGFNKLYYVTEIDDLDRELNNFPVQYTGVICLDSNSVSSGEIQVATSIRMFDLLTDFNFDSAIQVFGVSRAGTRINSLSFKWTSDVGELTPVIFFGDYNDWDFTKGNIPYFYEVEYGGFRWISINPNGAPEGEIPHEGSKYWKCQKTKGVTYDAYLEHDSDNITVDGDGNVVEGLWEETREGSVVSNVYKLHTAIFAQKNEEFLTLDYVDYGLWSQIDFSKIGGLPHHSLVEKDGVRYRWTNIVDAVASDVPGVSSGWERYTAPDAVGHYYIEIAPSDCYAVVKEGMLQIMAIEYVKDGVNSSGDDNWTDEQWENMRSMRRCAVNITVMMDGAQKKLLTYAVNIDHIPTQTITSDIDNQAGSLSWCESKKAYINNTGGIIRSSYKNAPISPYLAADDPTTPDHDESRYNPYVEFVNEQGVAVNVFNGTLSLVNLNESGRSYKGLKLEIAPKNPNSGTAILDGRYTAKVHFVVRVTGVYYEKVITHDILKDSKGVTFELAPSVSQIRATYNNQGALVPSVSMLGCSIILQDSEGKRDTSATDWIKYALSLKCNGENIAFGGLVKVSAEIREYEFVLYQNGEPTLDRESIPVVCDGMHGESTFILDLGNEMDTVPTKLNTAQTIVADGAFSLTVPIYAYLGTADIKDDTTISIDSRGGLSATQAYISNKNLVISIADGVALSSARYVVTLKGVHSGSTRTADFTLMRGIAGEAVFNIVPSVTSIAKHEDGSFTPTNVTAAVTRLQGGTATTLTTKTQFTQNGVVMAYKNSQGNIVAIDSSPSWGTSYYGDGLELYLYKGSTSGALLDKEFVPVVSDGKKGDPGTVVTGDAGANAHTVTFSPATLTIGTTDNGTLSGQVGNACPYIYPSVENGTVTSISLGTAVHCTASKENGSNVKRFWISAIDYEKYYKDDGSAGSASDYAVRIPYVTGYVPITVNYTDNTTGKAGSITANFEWQVSLAVFTGTVYNTNKQAVSRFENWRTVGNKVFNNVSEVIQDAENWMVGVTGLDLTNGKTIASYINLKADSATLENYATKTYADGVSTSVKEYYSGIGIGNGKIVGVMNKFALYKSGVGVSVAAVLNDNSGTYNAYRTLYYDSTKDAWIFRGTIYADAGEFKGKVTATEGSVGCVELGEDSVMVVEGSTPRVVISQRAIPSYDEQIDCNLAFGSASGNTTWSKTDWTLSNRTSGTTTTSTQLYAPTSKTTAMSRVGTILTATATITFGTKSGATNVNGLVLMSIVAYNGSTRVYSSTPRVVNYSTTAQTVSAVLCLNNTGYKYYIEFVGYGDYNITLANVKCNAKYSQTGVINYLGKNGALFGYSAAQNFSVRNGVARINDNYAVNFVMHCLVGFRTSNNTTEPYLQYVKYGNSSISATVSRSQKGKYHFSVTGLVSPKHPMVLCQGIYKLDGSTNRYTNCSLANYSQSGTNLTFDVWSSDGDQTIDYLPFEVTILDTSS